MILFSLIYIPINSKKMTDIKKSDNAKHKKAITLRVNQKMFDLIKNESAEYGVTSQAWIRMKLSNKI